MTNAQTGMLVLQDNAGEYYLLPQAMLDQGRVPAEHKAEVERLLAEADADVSGYMIETTYTLIRVINTGARAMGDFIADVALVQWIEQQMISGGKA